MSLLHKALIMLIIASLSLSFIGCSLKQVDVESVESITEKRYSLEELRADFNKFRSFIEENHPKLYTSDQELSELFDTQYALLEDNMGELEFYRILSPVVSVLRCGHTNLVTSNEYQEYMKERGRYLPFVIRVVDDRLYVYENLTSADIPSSSEIVSINGKSSQKIIETLLKNLTADGYNKTKKYYIMNNWFNGVFYNYVDNSNEFDLVYRKPDESENLEATVSSISDRSMYMTALSIYFVKRSDEENYYGEIFEDHAILTIKSFNVEDLRDYKQFVYSFFKELEEKDIENLVLDLRGNWGGPPAPAAFLYSYLNSEPTSFYGDTLFYYFAYKWPILPAANCFKGELYTLINGGSFSTTGHLISLLKYHNIGSFIGEESGGSGVVTAFGKFVNLRNTGLRLHCSTGVFNTAVEGLKKGRGIMPDYKVTLTMEDHIKEMEPEKEKAIKLIGGDSE